MTEPMTNSNCRKRYWTISAIVGVVLFVIFLAIFGWGFLASLPLAVVLAVLLGWFLIRSYCTEDVQPPARQSTAPAAAPKPADPPAESPIPAAELTPAPPGAPAPEPVEPDPKPAPEPAQPAAAPKDAGPAVKPSAELAGEAELAERKGSWKYEGEGEAKAEPEAKPAPEPEPKAAPAASPAAEPALVSEDAMGTRPAALDGPRDGGADDLKRIKGVGPKLEALLNSLGFYHFDQIAAWSADEVAWVDDNIVGFKGRVSRDDWVGQAKLLASGTETEFSKRVDKGDVY